MVNCYLQAQKAVRQKMTISWNQDKVNKVAIPTISKEGLMSFKWRMLGYVKAVQTFSEAKSNDASS